MSDESDRARSAAKPQHDFLVHVLNMPGWHKAVLLLGAILTVAGAVGVLVAKTHSDVPAQTASGSGSGSDSTPRGASKMVDTPNGSAPNGSVPSGAAPAAPQEGASMFTRLSPHAMKIGGSIVAGFVIGWLFRAFIKTMLLLAVLFIGGVWALSHFGILNLGAVDSEALQRHSGEAVTWMQAHLEQFKAMLVRHLPSTGGGAVGAFLGFRRR